MPLAIMRGSRDHCLEGLRQDKADLSEYPLRTYSDLDVFTVEGREVPIIQGVNTVPQDRFLVSLGEPAAAHAGLTVPGVAPFLVSTLQVSARHRACSPQPTVVGLPLLTTETAYLIKWMFAPDGAMNASQRLWRRLTDEELEAQPKQVRPDPAVEPDARTAASYYGVSGAVTSPEPVEYVQPRAGGLSHEPWLARSVDLAEHWRIVVPNTSVSCRPVIVPPALTIIGQNFNVLLCPSAEVAIAIGAVLSRRDPLEYLIGISPWSQGDTPRPRSKHVNSTLWRFQEDISELLARSATNLSSLGHNLSEVWNLHLAAAIALARGDASEGQPLRDSYRAIEPREGLNFVPESLEALEGRLLTLGTLDEAVLQIEFNSVEDASLAAVAAWTAMPRRLSIGAILQLRFQPTIRVHALAVTEVLLEKRWDSLVGEPDIGREPEGSTPRINRI